MRILFTLFVTLFFTVAVFSQSPEKMSYQSVIRNSSNELVKTTVVGMRISILQGSSSGTAIYVETQTPTTNANGLISIEIGAGTIVTGTFAGIDWSIGTYFIKTETDPLGSTTYSIEGTSQLLSVPYSLYSKTSEKANILEVKLQKLSNSVIAGGLVTDIEGNAYNTLKVGTQVWMAENLKTAKYNDGTPLANITIDATWAATNTGAYSDYSNTPANSTTYGKLYNWYAVDNNATTKVASNGGRNVCPTGWHVPTDAQWTTLTDYLTNNGYGYEGSGSDIGKSMASTSGWTTYATAGTLGNNQVSNNRSGFTALPSGTRGFNGSYYGIGDYSGWWSSTENNAIYVFYRLMSYSLSDVMRNDYYKQGGFSVRCLRDL